jgi:hypothetical protein
VVLLILLFDTNLDEHRVAVRREHLGFLLSETVRNPEEYTRKCRGFREAEGDLDRVAVAGAGGGQCLGVVGSGTRRGSSTLISKYSSSITHRGYATEDEPERGWASMAAAADVRFVALSRMAACIWNSGSCVSCIAIFILYTNKNFVDEFDSPFFCFPFVFFSFFFIRYIRVGLAGAKLSTS